MWPLSLRGGEGTALVAGPLTNYFFTASQITPVWGICLKWEQQQIYFARAERVLSYLLIQIPWKLNIQMEKELPSKGSLILIYTSSQSYVFLFAFSTGRRKKIPPSVVRPLRGGGEELGKGRTTREKEFF